MHEPHELALLIPRPSTADYERLRDDIAARGLVEPIVHYQDQVLDGVTRAQVCEELGITPRHVQFKGTEAEAAAFVFSKNVARRHLTTGQRAMIGVSLLPKLEQEAKDRMSKGAADRGTPSEPAKHRATEDAAKAVLVSPAAVQRAKQIKEKRPDLAAEVKKGTKTLNDANQEIIAANRKAHGGPKRVGNGQAGRPPDEPQAAKRPSTWNGKSRTARRKEIHNELAKGNYSRLLKLQMELTKVVTIVSDWSPEDFELDQATLALVDSFYDDLITLGEWHDRAVLATQAWLSSVSVRKKIAALRATTGRPAEEKETALRLADRLERKLEAQLPA